MDIKLTLKLDKEILQKAKLFARENKVSLSTLVENYFDSITNSALKRDFNISPTVKDLSGSIKVRGDVNIEKLRDQYLLEKYLHE